MNEQVTKTLPINAFYLSTLSQIKKNQKANNMQKHTLSPLELQHQIIVKSDVWKVKSKPNAVLHSFVWKTWHEGHNSKGELSP